MLQRFARRCQVERLESEKRSLLTDVSNFRDRVLELTHTIQIRDEELNRERRINDELENRYLKVETDQSDSYKKSLNKKTLAIKPEHRLCEIIFELGFRNA